MTKPHAPVWSATVFAALGDATRWSLVLRLGDGLALSIAQLTAGTALTRQAISKHLLVLEEAGLVTAIRRGREQLYVLEVDRVDDARRLLDGLSAGHDRARARLRARVEQRVEQRVGSG